MRKRKNEGVVEKNDEKEGVEKENEQNDEVVTWSKEAEICYLFYIMSDVLKAFISTIVTTIGEGKPF